MTAPRDALAQLEAVLALAEKASVGVREFAMPRVDAEFFAAALPFIRNNADTLRALLGAADGVWLPIATAPKDGTRVRLINMGTGVQDVGYWIDSSHVSQEQRDALWPDWFRNPDGTWPDGEWSQDEGNGDMTHWKSLPTLTKAPAND